MSGQLCAGHAAEYADDQLVTQRPKTRYTLVHLVICQLQRLRQPDNTRSVERSTAPPFFVTAPALTRYEFNAIPKVKNAYAFGSIELVRRHAQHIHAKRLNVQFQLPHRLHSIGMEQNAALSCQCRQRRDRRNRTNLVVGENHTCNGGILTKRCREILWIDHSHMVNRNQRALKSHIFDELLDSLADGVMFNRSRHQMICSSSLSCGQRCPANSEVVAFGSATGEDDFGRLAVEQSSDGFASILNRLFR